MKCALLILALCLAAAPAVAQDSFGNQPRQQRQQQYPQSQQQPGAKGFRQPPATSQQGQGIQPNFSRVAQMENQEFGVQPVKQLHTGSMHGPTPTTIPGGLMITTEALWSTLQQNPQGIAIFDVLGGPEIIPGALAAMPASQAGSFNDQTQQEFGNFLQQVTGGKKQIPLLFYCQSPQCWMSYNAALRAINMRYTQVLWYRGGIEEAWKMAGLPTQNPYAQSPMQGGLQGQQQTQQPY